MNIKIWIFRLWCCLIAYPSWRSFSWNVHRWPQMLAKQVSSRRPQLPGGCQLCVRADRSLLKRATAGLLLNVSAWTLLQFFYSGGGICTTLWSINSSLFSLMGWSVIPIKPLREPHWWHIRLFLFPLVSSIFFFLSLVLPFSLPFGSWRLAKNY